MSKKKSFSGSTMTLKDFHGGSIPSDLPLPSAPGVSVMPPDRWGPSSAIGIRPDGNHRLWPGSAGGGSGARMGPGFGGDVDDRGPPFLSTPANIGRHFDEDERKPFDASAAAFPRRHQAPSPLLSDPVARPAPLTAPAKPDPKARSRSAAGPAMNAWGLRREEVKPALDPGLPVQANSAVSLSSRFAQASAIEKISSGRWQTKPITPPPALEVDVIRVQETVMIEARLSSSLQPEVKDSGFYNIGGTRPVSSEGSLGGAPQLLQQQQQGLGVDAGNAPKLKLLPRAKQMDTNESRASEEKQGHQPTVDHVRMETPRELQGSINMPRPASAGEDMGSRVSERPRLNLKPRSFPVDQLVESTERERVKSDTPKTDMKSKLESTAQATMGSGRSEGFPDEQMSGKDFERKGFRSDTDKADTQRASWRNDNRKNTRVIEKPAERRPEPETWRKPVEKPRPEVSGTAPRVGKAASALELAQAFSRSVSDAQSDKSFPNQRSLPARVQARFSRLTDGRDIYSGSNPQQINGY